MSYEQLKLENQLCFPFYAVSRLIIRAYQDDLDRLGITYPQYLVLLVLWEHNTFTVNEIGEKLILNTNTITPLLKRMESMGLIERMPSEKDLRKVMVSLTDKGELLRKDAADVPYNLIKKLGVDSEQVNLNETVELKNKLNELIELLKNI